MRVFITGIDGYLGWPLALYLTARGHEVAGADCYLRRDWVAEMGSRSATPIPRMTDRGNAYTGRFKRGLRFYRGDLTDYSFVWNILRSFKPDAIVHLGEMPSAPYSMIDIEHMIFTHKNNLYGTLNLIYAMHDVCPDAHLVKLGTMGEYGTPEVDIPEGEFRIEYRGKTDVLPFPKQPGSFYHLTKVHDSNNINFACKTWGLKSTDIMQGVVYGIHIPEMKEDYLLLTRFDFDAVFGTAINRFCAQAVAGLPITPYGKGLQKRGFLPLRDSMQCLTLAIENPPCAGEYRVFNQFEEVYGLNELAERVQLVAKEMGLDSEIRRLENPRKEKEDHYYNPDHKKLLDLGYEPTTDMYEELKITISILMKYIDRIKSREHVLIPDIRWDGTRKEVRYL